MSYSEFGLQEVPFLSGTHAIEVHFCHLTGENHFSDIYDLDGNLSCKRWYNLCITTANKPFSCPLKPLKPPFGVKERPKKLFTLIPGLYHCLTPPVKSKSSYLARNSNKARFAGHKGFRGTLLKNLFSKTTFCITTWTPPSPWVNVGFECICAT